MCFKEFDEVAYIEMIRNESKLLTLVGLVNKAKLYIEDAADEANMSVADFQAKMKSFYETPDAKAIPVPSQACRKSSRRETGKTRGSAKNNP